MRTLSKSKLIAYRQCPKRLWLEVHQPDLREDSPATQARFQMGHHVGDIARRIYDPEGKGSLIDVATEGFPSALARTTKLLTEAKGPVFEAGFQANGALAFADVMLPELVNGQTVWRMVEVKSSASVKDYHHDDIAVQAFVVRAAGVKLKTVALAHIDSSWIYPGNEDYRGLLLENDLTAEAFARSDEVQGWIGEAQKIVAQPTAPEIAVGDQCYTPFECGFCNYCNRDNPPLKQVEHPIAWLPRFSAAKLEQLEDGVDDMSGVPDEMLSDKQALVKECTLANKVYYDAAGAAADLAPYGFPAYFLDFETIQFVVPIWKGTRPYQQIVFQFSLHTLDENGRLMHTAFLDFSGNDPSERLARAMITACGDHGPVFVYNASFEPARIGELAERHPDLAKPLLEINTRIVDLVLALGDTADCLILEAAAAYQCDRIYAVKGNHDPATSVPKPIVDLDLQTTEFDGLTFGGLSGSWKYKPAGHFLYEQDEVDDMLVGFPKVDVFVSHNSPLGIHDKPDGIHTGFSGLLAYIQRQQPRLLIHGHQHRNIETMVGGTRVLGVYGHRVLEI